MTVSVVVPTRNRRALLAMTLRSVLRQQQVELDVIVVDEASSDDTASMLASLDDARVRVIHHETPRGVSAARNHGAEAARGDWLAFVDDDDLWAPDKLARQLEAAGSAGRDWAYAGTVNIGEHGQVENGRPPLSPDEVMAALPHYNAIPGGGSNVVVRRSSWVRAGPFDVRLQNTEDWEMWIRLAKQGPPACVASPLVAYRVHGANASLDIAEIVRGTRLIEALHHTTADWGRLHLWLAESYLRKGQRTAALGQFARAAARGDATKALSDLATLARRRLTRLVTARQEDTAPADDRWIAAAAEWLTQLDAGTGVIGDGSRAPTTACRSHPTA
jgi:glycosyltransferase involved in cell wall biosynthesis